jgi:tyrosinase
MMLNLIQYNLFTHTPVYENFSTQSISGTSLEAVHGTVHVYVGGNYGHMTQLSYAAFDPIL